MPGGGIRGRPRRPWTWEQLPRRPVNRWPRPVRRTGHGAEPHRRACDSWPRGAARTARSRMLTRPPDPREDGQLLAAIMDGDRGAFAELYRRHLPWLLVRLGRRCSSPELVDEVVQDTFVAVWGAAGGGGGRGGGVAMGLGDGVPPPGGRVRGERAPAGWAVGVAGGGAA